MSDDFLPDLDGFFRRIAYGGPRTPTLETLKALHYAAALAIPFENLDVLAKRGIRIDLPSVQKKLVDNRRGGYCFEINALFMSVLQALGFTVTPLIARVRWMSPDHVPTGRSHMLLRVDLPEGPFIVDVGFGGLTMTAPIRFETDRVQETPHEPRRLIRHGEHYELQAPLDGNWVPIYRFNEEVQTSADYEVSNWYTSTHPQSIFTQFLLAARPFLDRRVSLFNTELTIRYLNGRVEKKVLETTQEIAAALAEHFELPLSDEERALILDPYIENWRGSAAA